MLVILMCEYPIYGNSRGNYCTISTKWGNPKFNI